MMHVAHFVYQWTSINVGTPQTLHVCKSHATSFLSNLVFYTFNLLLQYGLFCSYQIKESIDEVGIVDASDVVL